MQERPDDEAANDGLDRLFRKSAEEFEPPYEPAAWQLMSAKLDERDRVTVWGRVLRGTLAVMAFIVLVSGIWYGYKQTRIKLPETGLEVTKSVPLSDVEERSAPVGTRISEQLSAGRKQSTEPVASEPKKNLPKSDASQPQQETAGRHIDNQPMEIETSQRRRLSWPVVRQYSSADQTKKISTDSKLSLKATTAQESPAAMKNESEPTLRPFTKELQSKKLERAATTSRPVAEQTGPTGEISGYSSMNRTTADVVVDDSAMFSSKLSRIGPLDALSSRDVMRWPQWPTLTIPALALPQAEPTVENAAQPIRERGLSIRVVLSPDLSAVGTKNFTRPGNNYGLLVEYRFSKRFSAQAGVIQSKKIYTATPEQYAWPSNWQWYVKPVGVDGSCSMLDIPINLRYDFLRVPTGSGRSPADRSPARWFVSSGVTTYIMQKETYDYVYADPTNQWIKFRSFSAKTGRYNFSTMNLSVGYERPIGRRFAWQLEPFLKVPLKEVGYFKINLLSTGAFLSLRYRL